MSKVRGCNLPDDLYYQIDKHVWAKLLESGNIRIGITSVAVKLSGGDLAAVTVRSKKIGTEVAAGKSLATVESSKFVGPVPSPITGVLLRANESVTDDPSLVTSDPYGSGWIVEMQPSNWEAEKGSLATGTDGIKAYQAKLEAEEISCE